MSASGPTADDPIRLLAGLDGAAPAAPAWYRAAMARPCEVHRVDVAGAGIEVLCWGERRKPGILLMHGSSAHARWWGPVAPMLAEQYRVVSLSFSGMGGSDWRARYTIELMVDEAMAAAEMGGLWDGGMLPFVVAHSFGGNPALMLAARHGARIAGAILVDSVLLATAPGIERIPQYRPRFYESEQDGLARFRFAPQQGCENLFIVHDIARGSLRFDAELGVKPWTWRYDPDFYPKLDWEGFRPELADAGCRIAFISGAESTVVPADCIMQHRGVLPVGTPFVVIDAAGHHIMADQPIALSAAIRAFVACWG